MTCFERSKSLLEANGLGELQTGWGSQRCTITLLVLVFSWVIDSKENIEKPNIILQQLVFLHVKARLSTKLQHDVQNVIHHLFIFSSHYY